MIYILSGKDSLNVVKGVLKFPGVYKLEYHLYEVKDGDDLYYITEVGYSTKVSEEKSKILQVLYTTSRGIKEYCKKNNLARAEVADCLYDTIYMKWPGITVNKIESLAYDSKRSK